MGTALARVPQEGTIMALSDSDSDDSEKRRVRTETLRNEKKKRRDLIR